MFNNNTLTANSFKFFTKFGNLARPEQSGRLDRAHAQNLGVDNIDADRERETLSLFKLRIHIARGAFPVATDNIRNNDRGASTPRHLIVRLS